jgi:hypothetical protein
MKAPTRATHSCGRCHVGVFSARWTETGILVHVEPNAPRGDLMVVAELPGLRGVGLPHVAKVRRVTSLREHVCPSFSAASFNRKRRP